MPTSAEMSLRSAECLDFEKVTPFALGYLKSAAMDEAHETVLNIFLRESELDPRVTRAFIARRIGKAPEQITRALSAAGNSTLESYAYLLAAMGYRAKFGAEKLADSRWDNECHPLVVMEASVNRAEPPTITTTGTQTSITMSHATPTTTSAVQKFHIETAI